MSRGEGGVGPALAGDSARVRVLSTDPVVLRQVAAFARERDLSVDGPGEMAGSTVVAVVVDLGAPDAVESVRAWRSRCPDALIVGCHALPDRGRLEEAERAGCDAVGNRGAVGHLLRRRAGSGRPGRSRTALADQADLAGRLGLVLRLPDSPVGPVALYQLAGRLLAACDLCPHSGATLSGGDIVGTVVTCPAHGSRFDLASGERLRGPADRDLPTYDLVVEGGRVFLSWV